MSSNITDADLAYLRNINTQPGTNAGRSIDPTKPGPDAASRGWSGSSKMKQAADEIERLADLLKDYRLTFGDIHDVKWPADCAHEATKALRTTDRNT